MLAIICFLYYNWKMPSIAFFLPFLFIKDNCGAKAVFPCPYLKMRRCREGGKFSYPVPFKNRRLSMNLFLRRTYIKILLQSFHIHTAAIILNNYLVFTDIHPYFGSICIIGIVDKFPDEFYALPIKPLAYGNQVAFI